MRMLQEVGLGYIKVGQSATTLSGGEAQRVKLSKELSRRATGKTLYILDEPTTGLHFEDVRKLLEVLHRLVEQGNTVVVIEHNLDVIKTADWVIDLGPGGGVNGGRIIAEGPPERIVEEPLSATGQYLRPLLERASGSPAKAGAQPDKDSAAQSSKDSRATSSPLVGEERGEGRTKDSSKPSKPRRKRSAEGDADEFPDLIAAK